MPLRAADTLSYLICVVSSTIIAMAGPQRYGVDEQRIFTCLQDLGVFIALAPRCRVGVGRCHTVPDGQSA